VGKKACPPYAIILYVKKNMPNYRRADVPGACYFFTVVTFRCWNILIDDDCRICLRDDVLNTRKQYPFMIDAWVLLSNHLDCIWTLPTGDSNFSVHWNGIKRRFTLLAKHRLHKPEWVNLSRQKHREGTIWQRRFWEHQMRDNNDYQRHIDYIHYNPVKYGLVKNVVDWSHSIFHRYVKQGFYPAHWGNTANDDDQVMYGE
jgi:putative transposase